MFDGLIYLVNTQTGTYKPVFDTAVLTKPQILAMTQDGTRLIFPLLGTGQIIMLDISDPEKPSILSTVDLGTAAQPHDIGLTDDDNTECPNTSGDTLGCWSHSCATSRRD